MAKASREFQVFAKPIGAVCNLECHFCYYLKEEGLHGNRETSHMPDKILEEYIVQHIDAAPGPMIGFSWHGGEPTYLWPGLFLEGGGHWDGQVSRSSIGRISRQLFLHDIPPLFLFRDSIAGACVAPSV